MTQSQSGKGNVRRKTATTVTKTKKKQPAGLDRDMVAVTEFMNGLDHPFRNEVEEVRNIIRSVDVNIGERIKWRAPSYHYKGEDMVTFNLWAKQHVHLVFHHPAIVKVVSPMLEGKYDKRRMTYFEDMAAVKKGKKELIKIIKQLLDMI